ncbi:MAG TPA: hypothetical protein VFA18_03885, partial [Gemmataceae bacterium]|nr:hypothetical protein [Gemmataceae bacterium]
PWKTDPRALDEHMRLWKTREWQSWLSQRVSCPFPAIIAWPAPRGPQLAQVGALLSSTPEKAYEFGIYFDVADRNEWVAVGATAVTPVDVTSPAFAALREYQAYRQRVGKPPGMRGRPDYFRLP